MEDTEVANYVIERHIAGILIRNIEGDTQLLSEEIAKLKVVESAESEIGKELPYEKPPSELNKKFKYQQESPYVWGILSRLARLAEFKKTRLDRLLPPRDVELLETVLRKAEKHLQ
jgi:hypothetical protein